MHLAQLFFTEPDQLVVQVDGLQRLDEQCMPTAAGPMDDALDAPLAARDHRNHEAVVSNRHEIFLERAVLMMSAQKTFERFLNLVALPFAIAPQACERNTGVVGNRTIRQNFTA